MISRPRVGDPILVTGAGGFIGSVVVRTLVDEGALVRALLGPPGARVTAPPPGVEHGTAEIEDAGALRGLLDEVRVVVHLAGPASVAESHRDPASYARAHVGGTTALLEACRDGSVEHLVLVSSAEVYGRLGARDPSGDEGKGSPAPDRVTEDAPMGPRSPYGAAKLGAEAMARAVAPTIGLSVTVLRPFSVYGPGMREGSVIATIVRQAFDADEIVVADLRPVRDYCFVRDVAGAIAIAARRDPIGHVVVYNVGSGVGTSVGELADRALQVVGRSVPVRVGARDRPAGTDVLALIAHPGRIQDELGWRATTSLAEGLARTAAAHAGAGAHRA
jgi:nucleoside-diphosphate-sugar epimerase